MQRNSLLITTMVSLGFIMSLLLVPNNSLALNKPLTVAVFQFQVKDRSLKNMGSKISDLIMSDIAVNPDLKLVERDTLNSILDEQGLGLTGMVNDTQAVQVGKLAGAKIFIIGNAFTLDNELMIVAKIVSTETGGVLTEVAQGPLSNNISTIIKELSMRINKTISSKATEMIAKEGKREISVDQLVAKLKNKALPKVSVSIEERHIGAPAIDPAAETELVYHLKKCGFTVVSDANNTLDTGEPGFDKVIRSTSEVDVIIIGEAFSEYGTRRGELVSCKGRVEMKAINSKSGEVLAIGRKTSTSIDLSEQIAGKNALQQASVGILEQFIPELVDAWNESNMPL